MDSEPRLLTLPAWIGKNMFHKLRSIVWGLLLVSEGLAFAGTGRAQDQLRVSIWSGQDAVNDTRKRQEVRLAVQVEDAAPTPAPGTRVEGGRSPAAGARVDFEAPASGPSGTFANGLRMISVTADQMGRAEVEGFRPNDVAGSFEIRVTAHYQALEGTATIKQRNVAPGAKKLTGILVGAGGGTVAALALCCRGNDQPTPADLTIANTSSPSSFVRGSTGTFTLTVGNRGDTATNGTVTVTDMLPSGLTSTSAGGSGWNCSAGQTVSCTRADALNGGSSYPSITIGVNVASNAPASLTNSATVSGGGDTTPANNSATATVNTTAPPPDLTISKTASAGTFQRGGTGGFTLTVTNSGAAATNGTVTVGDPLPTGLTPTTAAGTGWTCPITGQNVNCTRADALNAGASYPPITINVNVASNAPAQLTNTATVSGGGDTTPANNSAAATVNTAAPPPDLTISKTASAPEFLRGGTGSFTLTVTNNGGSATNGTVTVGDPLPTGLTPTTADATGWSCPITGQNVNCTRADALNAGTSYPPITINVNIASNAPAQLTNTATVSGGGDTTPANNSATATVNTIVPPPDLTISKTASAPTFPRGGTGSFTLTVTNNGGSATNGTVTVDDTLPTGLTPTNANGSGWTCPPISGQNVRCTRTNALNPGASYSPITINVNVASNAPAQVTNTATVSGGGDTTPASGSVTVNTATGPDLTISKTANPSVFVRGQSASFTLTVTNIGLATNGNTVTATDMVPTGLIPTSATGTGWTCQIAALNVSCTRTGVLAAGASYPPITINVNVAQTAPDTVQNTAAVVGGGDTTPANSPTITVNIVNTLSVNSLSVTKEIAQPIVAPGDTVGFLLGISNPVETALTSTTLNDTLPLGFAYVEGSARIHSISTDGTDGAGQLITPTVTPDGLVFPIGDLPAGSLVTISYATLVTSNVRPGESQARVVGVASSLSGEPVTSVSAQVRFIITASTFTLNQVLVGRVFEDSNKNGRFDNGESGVANVRVVTSSGQAATTDSYGQYNLPSLAAGSVLLAIDPATLPPGLELTNKSGKLVRSPLNSGTMLRQNFALIRTSPASRAPELASPRITKTQEVQSGGELAKLEMIVERPIMAAGGYDKQLIRIRAFDESGRAAANTPIVVSTVTGSVTAASTASDRLECQSVLSLDQSPEMSRQVALETDSGEAAACLISDLVPSTTRLTASASGNTQIITTDDVRFEPAQRPPLLVAFGEVGIGLSGPATGATEGANRIDGQASIFYQNSLRGNDLLTVAVRSKQGVNTASGNTGFFEFDPTQRLYPVMGDASTRQELAQSMGHVYARYDRGRSYLMYGDLRGDSAAAEGGSGMLEYNRNVTGVRFRLEREKGEEETDWLQGQAARPKTAYIREVSTALAGSAVRLSRSQIVPGSETITLEVRDRRNPDRIISRERLTRNVDYMLDPLSGVLIMMRPIGLFDPSLNPIRLVSVYEYQNPGADSTVYLGRGSLSVNSLGLRLGFSALTQHEGELNFAVGGLQLEKRLMNGGRFVAEIPISRGRLLGDLAPSSDHFDGACCELDARRNGKAIRAEFEQPLGWRDTILRGRFARTDEGFFNPYGSITVQGQQSRAISLETRGLDSSRLTFSAGKEINRNRAVDNERQTFSAKLSQTLRENVLAEAGIDRREFLDHRSSQQIDSHLISAGLRWKPFSRLETAALREQNLGEADPTYPNQTVLGAQFQATSYTRLFATQRFSSAPILPIGGAELSGLVSPLSTRETAIGIESRLRQNTSLTTRYRMDSGPRGEDSFAVFGILTRLPVKPGLSVDWTLDNAVHLAGAGQGYIGGSIGFSQSKNDDLLVSARYELRRRNTMEFIFTTGVVGRLTESTSALARYRITSFGTGTASRITDGQLAVSVRPRQSDRIALLFSYDYGMANPSAVGAASYRRINRLSADGLLEVRNGLELYSRVALARIPAPYGGSHQATYLQARLQQSLLRRFDIAGEGRWIREASNVPGTLVTGVEWGTWLTQDFRIGLGYSAKGFANPGALLNSTAARGGAYVVISSQLSSLFDFMGKKSKGKV